MLPISFMLNRPYTILSSALSIDGYLDDTSQERLILSNAEDWREIDALRASSDAILVGANTLRKDNPSLQIRSETHQKNRLKAGLPAHPTRVTLTRSGSLSPRMAFFKNAGNSPLLYCTEERYELLVHRFDDCARIIPIGKDHIDLAHVLDDLSQKGINRLLIEGGSHIATGFLEHNLIDQLRLAIAPFFVGTPDAPRFVLPASYPFNKTNRMQLESVSRIGDMAVMTYTLPSTATS